MVYFFLFNSNLFSQNDKFELFNTDSTKTSKYAYDGLIKSENFITKKYGFIDTMGKLKIPYIFDDAHIFLNGFAAVKTKNKYGYIDTLGRIVIPTNYDGVSYFINDLAVVYKDNKAGIINRANEVILPFNFDLLSSGDNRRLINKKNNGSQFGLVSVDGQTILENKYSMIAHFQNTFYLAEKDKKWELFDSLGQLVFNEPFDEAYILRKHSLVKLKVNGKFGLFNIDGKMVIPFMYDDIYNPSEELIAVKNNDKWGFVNLNNKVIIPFSYDEVTNFSNGLSRVKIGDKYNLVNKNNELTFPVNLKSVYRIINSNLFSVGNRGSFQIYDEKIKRKLPVYFQSIAHCYHDRVRFKKDNKFGYLNSKGKIVILNNFEEAGSFSNGYSIVKVNDKSGIIDTFGNELLPIVYDEIRRYRGEQRILKKDGKFGVAVKTKIRIPVIYNFLKGTYFDKYITKQEEKLGLINLDNEVVLKNEYDEIIDSNYRYGYEVRKGDKWGFLQKDADSISVPIIHEEIEVKWPGVIVTKDGKKGLYSFDGALLLPVKYDDIDILSYPQISIKENDNWSSLSVLEISKNK